MPFIIPVCLQTGLYATWLSGEGNKVFTHPTFGKEKKSLRRAKRTLVFELPYVQICVI